MIHGVKAARAVRCHDAALRPQLEGPRAVPDRLQGPDRSSVALTARQAVLRIDRLPSLGHRRLKERVLPGWHPEGAPCPLPLGDGLPTDPCGPLPLRVDPLRHVVPRLPQMLPLVPGSDPIDAWCGTLVQPPPAPEEEDDTEQPKHVTPSVCRVLGRLLRSSLQ